MVFKWISKKTKLICLPDRSELTNKVQEIIEKRGHNIIISRNWADGFINQNFDKINKTKAGPIEEERIHVAKDLINDWFQLLNSIGLPSISPFLIFNIDEIGFGSIDAPKPKYKKVIVPSFIETDIACSIPRELNHLTMINCISCDGGLLKPAIIGINKNFLTIRKNYLKYFSETLKNQNGFIIFLNH